MLKTFLLATIAGVGAANIPAAGNVERSANSQSYLCSAVKKKFAQAKQLPAVSAYCSSYLNIPKTATKTVSKCTTVKATSTVYTATVQKPASVVTEVITGCARPTTTAASQPSGGDSAAPAPEGKRDVERQLEKRYFQPKPGCLAAYTKSRDISAACSCLGLKPRATTTTTVYSTKTSTQVVKVSLIITRTRVDSLLTALQTASTITGPPITTTVFSLGPAPTFAVANEVGGYLIFAEPTEQKRSESGLGHDLLGREAQNVKEIRSGFQPPIFVGQEFQFDDAILFKLNNPGGLSGEIQVVDVKRASSSTTPNGRVLVAPTTDDGLVQYDRPASPRLTPLTCSISFEPLDGTCPLDCQVVGSTDENQRQGTSTSGSWNLGPPGAISETTYKTFVVTQPDDTNSPQPGPEVERGQSGGGNRKRWDWNVPTGHEKDIQNEKRWDWNVPTGHGGVTENEAQNEKRWDWNVPTGHGGVTE